MGGNPKCTITVSKTLPEEMTLSLLRAIEELTDGHAVYVLLRGKLPRGEVMRISNSWQAMPSHYHTTEAATSQINTMRSMWPRR